MDTILIVDDSSYIVDGLIAFLKKQYRPLAAYGGAECLEILRRETPSVIILDIMMEPMDGWETLARIKENTKTRHIPVLMFSAKKISREEAEEHRFNIDDFITKPVSPKKITEAIEKVIARRDANQLFVERWQAAGISRDKIDAFLSLVTSLEVDLSLCQNMKIQYDLIHPEDKNDDEFQSVITAIEGRIQEERSQIETLTSEMNRLLETAADTGPEKVQTPAPSSLVPEGTGEDRASAGTGSGDVLPVIPPSEVRISPFPVSSPAAPSGEHDYRFPQETSPPPGLRETGPLPAGDVLQKNHVAAAEVVPKQPARMDISSAETGMEPAGPVPERQPVIVSGGSSPLPEQEVSPRAASLPPEDEPHPGGPDTIPRDEASTQYRPLVPADPDAFRVSQNEVPTGAGTPAPMPWTRSRERKKITEQPGTQPEPSGPVSLKTEGLVARVLGFITRFFKKK